MKTLVALFSILAAVLVLALTGHSDCVGWVAGFGLLVVYCLASVWEGK